MAARHSPPRPFHAKCVDNRVYLRTSPSLACSPGPCAPASSPDPLFVADDERELTPAEQRMLALMSDAGVRKAEDYVWRSVNAQVSLVCAEGHPCAPRPTDVLSRGQGFCRVCSRVNTKARARFEDRVLASVLELSDDYTWQGSRGEVVVTCPAGHSLTRRAHQVMADPTCRQCAGPARGASVPTASSERALARRLRTSGFTLAHGDFWRGFRSPILIGCPVGHEQLVLPDDVSSGLRCPSCSGVAWEDGEPCAFGHSAAASRRPVTLRRGRRGSPYSMPGYCLDCHSRELSAAQQELSDAIVTRLRNTGGKAILSEISGWIHPDTEVRHWCSQGHAESRQTVREIRDGALRCPECPSAASALREFRFLRAVHDQGGTQAPDYAWRGMRIPVSLICSAGHECSPKPATVMTHKTGICAKCSSGTEEARDRFLSLVAELGGRLDPSAEWRGVRHPVELVCQAGHPCAPMPQNVLGGSGLCRQCSVDFDRVYLLHHPAAAAGKIGIASSGSRVAVHESRGYVLVAQWFVDFPPAVEKAVIRRLRDAGVEPPVGVPRDGATETFPESMVFDVLAWVSDMVERPSSGAWLPSSAVTSGQLAGRG